MSIVAAVTHTSEDQDQSLGFQLVFSGVHAGLFCKCCPKPGVYLEKSRKSGIAAALSTPMNPMPFR